MHRRRFVMMGVVLVPIAAHAGLDEWLKERLRGSRGVSTLDPETAAAGLRQALEHGTQQAVAMLGRADGFFGNPRVKIPLPEKLARVDRALRKLGLGSTADEFLLSINRAAEAAVPEAKAIFLQVIRQMSVSDALGIVRGADDAATRYFRQHAEGALRERFHPIVATATQRVGVTQRYKKLLGEAGAVAALVDLRGLDIDAYVTQKALDGLFLMVADEERRIRQDPVARTTELLKKVFGK